jgi:hypothetical protein
VLQAVFFFPSSERLATSVKSVVLWPASSSHGPGGAHRV